MLYRVFTPTPELIDIVACYWYAAIAPHCHSSQQYNTPLFEGMVFNFTQLKEYRQYEGKTTCMTKTAYVFGQTTSCSIISGTHEDGGYIIGVRFKPLGLAKITGINMVHLANKSIDAEDIWSRELKWLCEAMRECKSPEATILVLENFLKEQRRKVHLHDRAKHVGQAISLMKAQKGNITGEVLQNLTNISRKTLERAFVNFHGLKPKIYNRIIRFNIAAQLMDNGTHQNLTELAYRLGYFDQSHFIRDFKQFSAKTPTEYFRTIEAERSKRTIPVD